MNKIYTVIISLILVVLSINAAAHNFNALEIDSKPLNEKRKVRISLPENYENSKQKYPLIVVLDGEFHTSHMREAVNILYQFGYPNAVIAGIENIDRGQDFTFAPSEEAPQGGGAKAFLNFIDEELLPKLSQNYRLSGHKTFFGHSAGGLFAGYTMINKPNLFDAFILVSPTFRWDNFSLMPALAKAIETRKTPTRIHLAYGNETGLEREGILRFQKLLAQSPASLKYQVKSHPEEDHNTVPYLGAYLGLHTVFGDFKAPDSLFDAPIEKVVSYYQNLEQEFGVDGKPPQRFLLQRGVLERTSKQYQKSINTFTLFSELYTDNPLPLIELAITYEAAGQLEGALETYLKSRAIMNWPADLDERISKLESLLK